MSTPLVLYSTNTWLAYRISEVYYRRRHYVWCSAFFSGDSVPSHDYSVPPSSSPCDIYQGLLQDVYKTDHHSAKIAANRVGLLRGANAKASAGIITPKQKADIFAIITAAQLIDFRPLIYVIPWHAVHQLIREVPVKEKSHPLSNEYVIERLPRQCFDIIEVVKKAY